MKTFYNCTARNLSIRKELIGNFFDKIWKTDVIWTIGKYTLPSLQISFTLRLLRATYMNSSIREKKSLADKR